MFLLQVLFHHVLSGEIPTDKLVGMTAEQLANQELARWRERETKHVCISFVLAFSFVRKQGHNSHKFSCFGITAIISGCNNRKFSNAQYSHMLQLL